MAVYEGLDTDQIRSAIVERLKIAKLYRPKDHLARKFINKLIEIPIDQIMLDNIIRHRDREGLQSDVDEIALQLYSTNAIPGMLEVEDVEGDVNAFLEDVERRFNRSAALSI